MDDVKTMLQSRTVWSGIVAILGVLLNATGHSLAPADQVALVDGATQIITVLGSVGAIYFRVKATSIIAKK